MCRITKDEFTADKKSLFDVRVCRKTLNVLEGELSTLEVKGGGFLTAFPMRTLGRL